MEEELTCIVCKNIFNNPVLLPCYHSLCLNCAVVIQQPAQNLPCFQDEAVNGLNECSGDYLEVDKLSLVSETDSGVVCNSRPGSYVGTPNGQSLVFPPLPSSALSLTCPSCQKIVYFDENGALNLPRNRALRNIADRYSESKHLTVRCELCEGESPGEASVMCEQCEVFYCQSCRDSCHPARGPLAKHSLLSPLEGKALLRARNRTREPKCTEHTEELLSVYCLLCKVPVCVQCIKTGRHISHDVQALGAMCKTQKTELSQNLQLLSEKAKGTSEFIQQLKGMTEKVNDNCTQLEKDIDEHCNCLIDAILTRKNELIEYVRKENECKVKSLKEQVSSYTGKLQQITGLLQFCIEALKETDHTAFLQVGSSLIHRVLILEKGWHSELSMKPWASEDFSYTLDSQAVHHAVENMNFNQMKPPCPPLIIPEDCITENNRITVAWQPDPMSFVDGFILELDDGYNGEFREVYCGKESICTLDGLHFNSTYHARVKAYNNTGEGEYSKTISLQTADVAWFTLNPLTSHPDVSLLNENQMVKCDSFEHRVIFGSLGFSRGIHYWEFTIEKYEGNADPAFGIARFDCAKDIMLGKDDKSWSMYIDHQRSWFLHADSHESRTEGGIGVGSVIGVLLDLEVHQLSFYVNDECQGPVAFSNLHGVFFPALSINRYVQVSLQTSLEPPVKKS